MKTPILTIVLLLITPSAFGMLRFSPVRSITPCTTRLHAIPKRYFEDYLPVGALSEDYLHRSPCSEHMYEKEEKKLTVKEKKESGSCNTVRDNGKCPYQCKNITQCHSHAKAMVDTWLFKDIEKPYAQIDKDIERFYESMGCTRNVF